MIETDDTRLFFFSLSDFAIEATLTLAGGTSTVINGIYEDPHEGVDAGGSMEVSSYQPTFTTRAVDVANAAYGDQLVAQSRTFIIRDIQADGTGISTLILEEQ